MLLRCLSALEPDGGSTAALARLCDLPRPTAHRLLVSLVEEGFVDRGADGSWFLGPELFLLGQAAAHRYDDRALAAPIVRHLAHITEESAFYSKRHGAETVCMLREDGSFPLRSHVLHEGIRLPLGVASAGLAVLAFLPDREIDEYFRSADPGRDFGPGHTEAEIRQRVRLTRDRGYCVNPGLLVEGSWGMAAPVLDQAHRPIGALSLTGVEHRFRPDRQPRLGELLRRSAHQLSRQLAGAEAGRERPPA